MNSIRSNDAKNRGKKINIERRIDLCYSLDWKPQSSGCDMVIFLVISSHLLVLRAFLSNKRDVNLSGGQYFCFLLAFARRKLNICLPKVTYSSEIK